MCDDCSDQEDETVRLVDSSFCVAVSALRPKKPGVQLGRGGNNVNIWSKGDLIRLMMVNDGSDLRSSIGMIRIVSATLADGFLDADSNCRLATSDA